MLPARDIILADLVRLRDEGEARESDPESQFVGNECRVAVYALVSGNDAAARNEILGGMQHLRILAETAIRLRWIAGDRDEPSSDGYLLVDRGTAVARTRSMRKRDLGLLAAAYRAINETRRGTFEDLSVQLAELRDRIEEEAAPDGLRSMAVTGPARNLYAAHRLCSAMVHPGAGMTQREPMPRARLEAMLDEAAYPCVVIATSLLRTLAGGSGQ